MAEREQNVVLITADSFRADHCGFLNAQVDLTPTLDALADESVVFETAIASAPRTPTSVPEMLTGRPMPHEATGSFGEQVNRVTNHVQRNETLPERLSDAGYTTVAYSANPWISSRCGFDELFDEFYEVGSDQRGFLDDVSIPLLSDTPLETFFDLFSQWRHKRGFFSRWPAFFDRLEETVQNASEPFFLWTFLLDTHNPYIVSRPDRVENSTFGMYYGMLRGNSMITHSDGQSRLKDQLPARVESYVERAYRDAVRSVDRFVSELVELTAPFDPLVVFNADHGEAFDEHGTYGHQQALYEENIHVPMVVHDSSDGESRRLSRPFSLRNLSDLLVGTVRDGTPVSSDEWTDSHVISRTESGDKIAVRTDAQKYIRNQNGAELYDLTTDPNERRSLIAAGVDTSEFERRIEEYLSTVPEPQLDERMTELSDAARRRLSRLGYKE